MSEARLIFPNMRGGCATVDGKVHALFRVNGRRPGLKSLMASADRVVASRPDDAIPKIENQAET